MSTVTVQIVCILYTTFFNLMNGCTDPASTQNNILSFFLPKETGKQQSRKDCSWSFRWFSVGKLVSTEIVSSFSIRRTSGRTSASFYLKWQKRKSKNLAQSACKWCICPDKQNKSIRSLRFLACVQTSPLPQKKSGEETLHPIFSEEGGTSVHRLRF